MRNTRSIYHSAMGLLALLFVSTSLQAQTSVQPVVVKAVGSTPEPVEVVVQNAGAENAVYRIYLMDYTQSPEGEHEFFAPGAIAGSCASNLTVSHDVLTLSGGESQPVVVRFTPGEQDCWSVLFVERLGDRPDGIQAWSRVGVKILRERSNTERLASIEDLQLAQISEDAERTIEFRFLNQGTAPLTADGDVEIRTLEGERVARIPIEFFSTLPRQERIIRLPLPRVLGAGEYLAVPIIEYGGEDLAAAQTLFRLP